jgi:uncharacterized phage protein gp47/JayE
MANTVYQYIDNTGTILADTSTVLTDVQNEWRTAYGSDISVTPDTDQGKMIAAETSARVAVANNNAVVANQINPNFAGGIFLDAICALLGLTREPATFTIVPAVLSGQPLTIIPAGIQARGTSTGIIFTSSAQVQLDNSGNANVDFTCIQSGPVQCPENDLTVLTSVLGWETITNSSATVIGQLEQSDDSLRALRNQALALQGISTPEAQASSLAAVPGVLSFKYQENYEDTPVTKNGILLKANSVWACVDGGSFTDVAMSLFTNKTDGAGWNGAITVPVTDPTTGSVYNIQLDVTTTVPLICQVTCRQGTSTDDLTTAIPNAVLAYQAGLVPGQPGFVTGLNASPFEISLACGSQIEGINIAQVKIAKLADGFGALSTNEVPILWTQKATITFSSITVVIIS